MGFRSPRVRLPVTLNREIQRSEEALSVLWVVREALDPVPDSPDVQARIPTQFEQAGDAPRPVPEKDPLRMHPVDEIRPNQEAPGSPIGIHHGARQVLAPVPDHVRVLSWRGTEARRWSDPQFAFGSAETQRGQEPITIFGS